MSKMFKRGFIFSELAAQRRAKINPVLIGHIREEQTASRNGKTKWDVINTPLSDYTWDGLNIDFEKRLLEKIQNRTSSTPLRVLDIGIGTGKQWVKFLEANGLTLGREIELHGTALTKQTVHPLIRKQVRLATANNVHRKFPADHFDVVVSSFGMHFQEKEGLEDALHVVKPNGEVIVVGPGNRLPQLQENNPHYALLDFAKKESRWGYLIRKK